jgi:hypothetical protein
MLRIGVQLPTRFGDAGEYLADARALDAAGAHSLWLDEGPSDPWLLLAGVAAVTGRAHLVAPITAVDGSTPSDLALRMTTLDRLSRGRLVVRLGGCSTPRALSTAIGRVREAGTWPILLDWPAGSDEGAAHLCEGMIGPEGGSAGWQSAFQVVSRRADGSARATGFEGWARIAQPESREHWREMLKDFEGAGAIGVIVRADPRLLDILRNADEDEDRSDLTLTQG